MVRRTRAVLNDRRLTDLFQNHLDHVIAEVQRREAFITKDIETEPVERITVGAELQRLHTEAAQDFASGVDLRLLVGVWRTLEPRPFAIADCCQICCMFAAFALDA
jgi:hypothetical protein